MKPNKYKISNYNFLVEHIDKRAVYNLVTNEFNLVSEELYSFLKDCELKGESIESSHFDDELTLMLRKCGILVNYDENELQKLKYAYNKDKYDDKFISLVVYPTLNCNFDCHYCYEDNKKQSMSNKDIAIVSNYLQALTKEKEFIAIRWSGGEPLLRWNDIYNCAKKTIESCDKNNCNYISSIITNGSLLTDKIIEQMVEVKISSIQITLDGPPEIHNIVRFYKNGEGSFNKILESIEVASKKLKVILRLNVDKRNLPHMEELFSILASSKINKNNVRLFCKPVTCSVAKTPEAPVFSNKEFYDVELTLLKLAEKFGLMYAFHWGIKARNTRCLYHSTNAFLLDPKLKLYKCPIYIGGDDDSKVIGVINNDGLKIQNYGEYYRTLDYSPFENEECVTCKVLPMCFGKCPVVWEMNKKSMDEGCIPEKHSFTKKLEYSISSPMQMKALQQTTISGK